MEGKFLVTCDGKHKIVQCAKSNLALEIRRIFCLASKFSVQVFDEEFQAWIDYDDLETISFKSKLRIVKGK